MHFVPGSLLTAAERAALKIRLAIVRFCFETKAVSTVEYALIVVAVVGIIGAAAAMMGGAFNELFDGFENQIQSVQNNINSP